MSVKELVEKSDFIIEAACPDVAKAIIPKILQCHKQALILSVGGVIQIKNLERLLQKSRGCIYIPSGAIAGVDALLACKGASIKRVRITTRKPVRSLLGAPFMKKAKNELNKIRKTTLIFEGTAEQAVRYFPQNINVAATLSLAGVGSKRTLVRIYTSPTYRFNSHEIEIEGDFGRIHSKVTNIPSEENPKTSALAIGSAIATLGKIFSRLKVGT
ncbi:MAG: hypothetical protein A3G33_10275 [Omnitrophica bacterium RIFCSPLOWO2_12_FULL_44_17]|uniref:Aspartate dehydrogenase domain-containing protein n=1 Tax=Candidatus Danuiimicrobium aquiferis TaxID=1801832 RepID=A0A1G1L222_9BACT|nr:MAG: hypothetical protein A3B72_08335 [Omnitrophica bacterium RIFCSPHIGHO2_02_FULL_45_28]OGW99213.1 MAG: hypothetical protein A3G33_10275 [Omnitrophica bacterium RIFCSPLOWO2_12_FULL_44_17]OGX04433.1 MAG: hypothetical protein A3J12_00335 [Omnitrophica bacterium RIFCSPLOWO2_02_FULL_44_11]